MIDFTHLPQKNKAYGGANGNKISVVYEGELYMLKFPAHARLNKDLSYTHSSFSEYLGCHIFESLGFPVQKTLLGTYSVKGMDKVVVACRDFTRPGIVFQDFASLKNQMVDSERNGYGTELSDILYAIEHQSMTDSATLLEWFWDIFIVDALIGNWDRHNGNWGFLYNAYTDEVQIAPVFDCGSSLYPQADDEIIHKILTQNDQLKFRIYEIPTSAIMINNKKLRYYDFISSHSDNGCDRALNRIVPKIDMNAIHTMIDEMPYVTDLQKDFYKTMIGARKTMILDASMRG